MISKLVQHQIQLMASTDGTFVDVKTASDLSDSSIIPFNNKKNAWPLS
jgi:hypothetical protein